MHWRKMFDDRFIGEWDLPHDKDTVLVISHVQAEKVKNAQGKEDRKGCVFFEGTSTGKGLLLNRTNAKAIAGIYGNDTEAWVGKPIALYVTEVSAFGTTTPAVRVRPTAPRARRPKPPVPATPAHDPMPEEGAHAGE